jgi:hypothetical protein
VLHTCIQSAPLPNRNAKSLLQDKTSENETYHSSRSIAGLRMGSDIPPRSTSSSDITNHMDPLHCVRKYSNRRAPLYSLVSCLLSFTHCFKLELQWHVIHRAVFEL